MLTEEAVNSMKPGAVIVDLAASTGGNVAFTKPGEDVDHNGVTILGPLNLPATVPGHASQLYSRNLTSFIALINDKGTLKIDMNDDILKGGLRRLPGRQRSSESGRGPWDIPWRKATLMAQAALVDR
jgi:NAD/NADP transhydrogenase alpha subunit